MKQRQSQQIKQKTLDCVESVADNGWKFNIPHVLDLKFFEKEVNKYTDWQRISDKLGMEIDQQFKNMVINIMQLKSTKTPLNSNYVKYSQKYANENKNKELTHKCVKRKLSDASNTNNKQPRRKKHKIVQLL